MKLAYLAQSTIPSTAANSVHVMKMCAAFASAGAEVELVVPDVPGDGVGDVHAHYGVARNFAVRRVPYTDPKGSRLVYAFSAARLWMQFRRAVRDFRPDVIYGRSVIGCHAGASLGIRTCLEVHQPVWGSLVEGALFRSLIGKEPFCGLVTITSALKSMYEAEGATGGKPVLVAPDAADPSDLGDVPENWPGGPGRLQVGYVGSLNLGRGIEVILELARRNPDVDFHLVGGSEADRRRLEENLSSPNVHAHGFVPPSRTHLYRNACDVLLAPYQRSVRVHGGEGDTASYCSPLKIFEYMSARKPMLVSDLPVFHEVLGAGNAVLLPPDDVDAWEEALNRLRDGAARHALAEEAYGDFVANHTWEKRAEKLLSHLGRMGG